ncbi:hypothetical protein QBC34DRAFT_98112 [Podospora aff. communis PSN243]|uniref:Uncharacterized protein n=1 Tax=Podospora aff. communis PSN243 TaxID=3040156 RepID=A0AAV9GNM1_9PEZI|nr:hypothetical protein QBC34DRAFT_98112 [Podospora aff. communis PSN243]
MAASRSSSLCHDSTAGATRGIGTGTSTQSCIRLYRLTAPGMAGAQALQWAVLGLIGWHGVARGHPRRQSDTRTTFCRRLPFPNDPQKVRSHSWLLPMSPLSPDERIWRARTLNSGTDSPPLPRCPVPCLPEVMLYPFCIAISSILTALLPFSCPPGTEEAETKMGIGRSKRKKKKMVTRKMAAFAPAFREQRGGRGMTSSPYRAAILSSSNTQPANILCQVDIWQN